MRKFWIDTFAAQGAQLAVSAAIAGVLTYIFKPDREWLFVFFLILGVLILGPIIFGIKRGLVQAVVLWLQRKRHRDNLLIELRQGNMPTNDGLPYFDSDEYLLAVATDEKLEARQRIKATEILASLQTLRTTNMLAAMFTNSALDAALREHFLTRSADDQEEQ